MVAQTLNESSSDSVSVVVVEDEETLATLYSGVLDDEFSVQTATSGQEALDLIDNSVDVVLLDRHLPDLNGDEVLRELRARGNDAPVALVTAIEPDADIVDMPFDEYVRKPVDKTELVETVRILANRSMFEEKSRELFRLASKKSILDSETPDGRSQEGYRRLVTRMTELQSELNSTLQKLLEEKAALQSTSDLSQEEIQSLLSKVGDHELPQSVRQLVEDYQGLKDARPPFMWKWVHQLAPQNTLPCVTPEYRETVPIDKTITILFITLLDDALEKHRDRATFNELAKIPFPDKTATITDEVNSQYITFAQRVWDTLLTRLIEAPNYDVYADLLEYDMSQAVKAIEYSDLAIRRPDLTTMSDLERYESHNMVMFAYADIDLMYSPLEMHADLGVLRDAIETAQIMARIGNWVSTWEREFHEGDYSSGPIVYALDNGIISRSTLATDGTPTDQKIEAYIDRIKANGVEKKFLTRWEQLYQQLCGYNDDISTMDLTPFIEGTEEVLRYHLASTGLK